MHLEDLLTSEVFQVKVVILCLLHHIRNVSFASLSCKQSLLSFHFRLILQTFYMIRVGLKVKLESELVDVILCIDLVYLSHVIS